VRVGLSPEGTIRLVKIYYYPDGWGEPELKNPRQRKGAFHFFHDTENELISTDKHKYTSKMEERCTTDVKSKNSQVASNGNLAEDILCKSSDILDKLGTQYFKKKIVYCEKIKKKKSDLRFIFEDGTSTIIQLKSGTGGGHGWSFDRRKLMNMPISELFKDLLNTVCLKSGGERKTVSNDRSLLSRLFLGDEELTKPQHFVHVIVKDGKITSLSVCPTALFIDTLVNDMYENCDAKRTCVHLTPLIYLQRKGGGKKDNSPDDIQAKLRRMPNCMTEITLD
jgi:hypothetical protein